MATFEEYKKHLGERYSHSAQGSDVVVCYDANDNVIGLYSSLYQEGQDAYKDGKEPSECPYEGSFTVEYGDAYEWLDGWLDARETFQGERGV